MASKSKSTGRAIISAFGALPAEDDPRWMDIDAINAAVDQMDVDTPPTASTQPKSLEDIRDMAWAKHNAPSGQQAEATFRARPAKQPQTLDDLQASAWQRFNNPGRSQTQGER
jgi:hypothetical protein